MLVALAPPRTIAKPQRMCVSGTPWPYGVDEFIVDILLGVVDDTLDILFEVIDESPEPNRAVLGQVVVASAGDDRV